MTYNGISALDSRVWYDTVENKPIFVEAYSNHTQDVIKNPEKYRLAKDFFKGRESAYDYDGYVLLSAMKHGFVRIYIDYKQPQKNSNIEGIELREDHIAAIWLEKFVGHFEKLVVVVRKSEEEKDGDAYILDTMEKIDFFLKWGKILKDSF
jgi:hypothetical protein